jgi:cell division protein FtsQ
MSQKNRRKPTTARKAIAAEGKQRKVRNAKAKTGSFLDGVMALLPFSEQTLHRIVLAVVLGGVVSIAWIAAAMMGVPAMAQKQIATIASDAGFEVVHIEVQGVEHLNELQVYERALVEQNRAMPLVDLEGLRQELLALSWVKDARVSRQLPDTLVIDIVEREPHAVLRKADHFVLIDETGHELEPISRRAAEGRLIVSGLGAGQQVKSLAHLLAAAPALTPRVREAEWIGNRRWNLTFKTGQVLALPEGDERSSSALVSFARLDGTNRLLGGPVKVVDMRGKDRVYLRIPDRAKLEAALAAGSGRTLEETD